MLSKFNKVYVCTEVFMNRRQKIQTNLCGVGGRGSEARQRTGREDGNDNNGQGDETRQDKGNGG